MSEDTPVSFLSPEELVEHLRALRARIEEFTPLTSKQREALRIHAKLPPGVMASGVSALGSHDKLQQLLGTRAEEVFEKEAVTNRWTAVESELKLMLNGVSGANFLRRRAIAQIIAKIWIISQQLARDPENALIRPHVEEMQRQRSYWRRKGRTPPETPPETTPPAEE